MSQHWNDAHAKESDLKVACPDCDQKFITKGVLALHTHAKHKRSLSCSQCGKMVADATSLRDHEMRHKGIKQFKCEVCGHETVTKTALQSHIR